MLLQEAYRHCKAIAAWGTGVDVLIAAGIDADSAGRLGGDSVGAGVHRRAASQRSGCTGHGSAPNS